MLLAHGLIETRSREGTTSAVARRAKDETCMHILFIGTGSREAHEVFPERLTVTEYDLKTVQCSRPCFGQLFELLP